MANDKYTREHTAMTHRHDEPPTCPDDMLDWIREYDDAAEWCAMHHATGAHVSDLPVGLSKRVLEEIAYDPEAFATRVLECAYARARARGEE